MKTLHERCRSRLNVQSSRFVFVVPVRRSVFQVPGSWFGFVGPNDERRTPNVEPRTSNLNPEHEP